MNYSYIWYNPDTKNYKIGAGSAYKTEKLTSNNQDGFTLLYKLKPRAMKVGKKLVTELNQARAEQKNHEQVYEFSLAS